jgi:hypothetical protein
VDAYQVNLEVGVCSFHGMEDGYEVNTGGRSTPYVACKDRKMGKKLILKLRANNLQRTGRCVPSYSNTGGRST